jgi:cyclophilin family peptidyl-prolyl cis-trans isomerase
MVTLLASVLFAATACSSSGASKGSTSSNDAAAQTASAAPSSAVTVPPSGPKIRIVTTAGTIVAVLDPKDAPKTVANFLRYVDRKFYNGGTFFRAIPGFVIQGGNKAKESPNDVPIPLEDTSVTGLKNLDGSLAMARTSDPNSATSEFFIDDGAQTSLDGGPGMPGYAAFGKVVSGMDVVRKIVQLPANGQYLVTPVTIVKIERVSK